MIYACDEYELDTWLYDLRRAGAFLQLEPKVFDLLVDLIQHRDRIVSNTMRRKYVASCTLRLTHKTRRDPPRQTGGVIAVRSTKHELREHLWPSQFISMCRTCLDKILADNARYLYGLVE